MGGIDTNFLGTDEFIKLCRLIGSKPLICVNQGNGTAHEAAAWVEYCNGSPDTYWGRKRGGKRPSRALWSRVLGGGQ